MAHRAGRVRRLGRFCRESLRTGGSALTSDDYPAAVRFINDQGYDALITGSDEVWKLAATNPRPFPNPYWLGNGIEARKFSYAASANKTTLDGVPDEQRTFIREALQSYQLLGVRDTHTEEFARHLAGPERVVRVPDPTFLLDGFDEPEVEGKLRRHGFDSRPAVVVNLGPGKLATAVASFFKRKGWQVVAVSEYQRDADVNLAGRLDPLEWIGVIARCQFAVSHRFHGTIFSILGGVPFLAVQNVSPGAAPNRKVADLLDEFGMPERLFTHVPTTFSEPPLHEALEAALATSLPADLHERVSARRTTGLAFLHRIGGLV